MDEKKFTCGKSGGHITYLCRKTDKEHKVNWMHDMGGMVLWFGWQRALSMGFTFTFFLLFVHDSDGRYF